MMKNNYSKPDSVLILTGVVIIIATILIALIVTGIIS
jgi:hypothetical protein